MFRIIITFIIAALLSNGLPTSAQSQSTRDIKFKREIVACGTNQNVRIKLSSKEALEGRIADIREDSFTLQFVDDTGQVTNREVPYNELSKVSKVSGRKMASTMKRGFLYGVGFYAGMVAVSLVVIGIASAASR